MTRGVGDPTFVTYDPIWADGDPVETDYPDGYRTLVSLFASPSYHPNTMIVLVMDNEEYANSPPAIGRRSALTGEWEQAPGPVDKVALIDYGDGPGAFVWDDYMFPVFWPPTSSKLYTLRYSDGGTASDFWYVEINADYPFTFSQRSETPDDKGLANVWDGWSAFSYNSDGSMIASFQRGEFPSLAKFSMWAPGPNIVTYFQSTDAVFAGLWDANSIPSGLLIDKHDHLWVMVGTVVTDGAAQLYFDEFSWTVGLSDITLTHLNRYELINQDGGFNTWTYDIGTGPFSIGGCTYNEDTDCIVIHWQCSLPSETNTNRDPAAIDYGGFINTPAQWRITQWDLATRSKKLSDADSTLLMKSTGGLLTDFGAGGPDEAGRDGFLGTVLNRKGDRMFGTWTKQDWTCYAALRVIPGDSRHEGFYYVDIATGIATLYGPDTWPDFLVDSGVSGDDPGVYSFAGAIYEPQSEKFWAGRRNEGNEGHFEGSAWYYTTDGLGIYGWESDDPCLEFAGYDDEDLPETEPPCDVEWPFADLQPRSIGIFQVPATLGGGVALTQNEEAVENPAGFWRFALNDIPIRSLRQVRKWREVQTLLNGRQGTCCVHIYDGKRAPWLVVGDPIVASAASAFAAGATTGSVEVTSGGVPQAGQHFSAGERLYRLLTVGAPGSDPSIYPVTIWPEVRAAIAIDDPLEFAHPICRCRLESDDGMAVNLDLLRYATPSVNFVEDI